MIWNNMLLTFTIVLLLHVMQVSSKSWNKVAHAVDTDMVIHMPNYAQFRYVHRPEYKNFSRILFWTPAYTKDAWFWWFGEDKRAETCPYLPCHFTTDHKYLNESDAVLFMVFGETMDLKSDIRPQIPPHRQPHQRYVFFSTEPPKRSEMNFTVLNGFFNWTMTYRRDSDVHAHFGKVILSRLPGEARAVDEHRDYAAGKSKMAIWIVSHCPTPGHRELYVQRLQKRLQVISEYKFYLSFENNMCKDYVSEKLMVALATDTVPVVFGGADYSLYAPAGSYINTKDFESPEALADYLLFLDANPSEYNRYFDWKRGYEAKVLRTQLFACELCAKLLQDDTQVAKTYDDFEQWWTEEGNCTGWEDSSVHRGSEASTNK